MRSKTFIMVIGLMALLATQTSAQTSHYVASDPAVREMKQSLDMPRTITAAESAASDTLFPLAPLNVSGSWHLELTDGTSVNLALNQSEDVLFGQGNEAFASGSQQATASGMISGNSLKLNVVPASGMELFAISIDISKLPLTGTYSRFSMGMNPQSGGLKASWLPY